MSSAGCTLTRDGAITNVPVAQQISVRYVFATESKRDLAIPYAVAVNGVVLAEYANRPRELGNDRTIALKVNAGCKVTLFLNSDAYPRNRKRPVYEVNVGSDDVAIEIRETQGCLPRVMPTINRESCSTVLSNGRQLVRYKGLLTGDIWMSVSHRYTKEEAEELMQSHTSPTIRQAVLRIYGASGLPQRSLELEFPPIGQSSGRRLLVKFDDNIDQNARQNIGFCPLLSEVLPRTHPRAFALLFAEAHAAELNEICISSSWRPLIGAIVHRLGLGLDINYIRNSEKRLRLNLAGLRNSGTVSNPNLHQSETETYRAFKAKLREREQCESEIANAKRSYRKDKDPDKDKILDHEIERLNNELKPIDNDITKLRRDWKDEHDKHQPGMVRELRERLATNADVTQVLDPWYLDTNTRDNKPPIANAQLGQLESSHNDHLHITLNERHLL